jgi:hypothetical protein
MMIRHLASLIFISITLFIFQGCVVSESRSHDSPFLLFGLIAGFFLIVSVITALATDNQERRKTALLIAGISLLIAFFSA